jgi:hypothetical protein
MAQTPVQRGYQHCMLAGINNVNILNLGVAEILFCKQNSLI